MKEAVLRRDALDFRRGVLGKRKTSKAMCWAVAAPLQSLFSLQGMECELVEGEVTTGGERWVHFWLRLPSGRILDPTADQFATPEGERMPPVYIGSQPAWYKVCGGHPPQERG